MIKVETLGMMHVNNNVPDLKSEKDVKNHSFVTIEDILYLVDNVITGDNAYREDVVIRAGEFLNLYRVDEWVGKKLCIDGKHIVGGAKELVAGDVLVVNADGMLEKGSAAGVHFIVTDKTTLTEAAVKARIAVA